MNITLVEGPRLAFPLNHASNVVVAPLGIAYIAAAIEVAGHEVHVVDGIGEGMTNYTAFGPVYLRGLTFEDIVAKIDPKTDAIGISTMFSCGWPATRNLIHLIHKRFPTKPIVFGGEHPTGMAEITLVIRPTNPSARHSGRP